MDAQARTSVASKATKTSVAPSASAAGTTRRSRCAGAWAPLTPRTTRGVGGGSPQPRLLAAAVGAAPGRQAPSSAINHFTIVGVEPKGFAGVNVGLSSDVIIPLRARAFGATGIWETPSGPGSRSWAGCARTSRSNGRRKN